MTSVTIFRYLGFVKHDDDLPRTATLNISFFLNEICCEEPATLKNVVRWAAKQKGWEWSLVAKGIFLNYFVTNRLQEYTEMTLFINDESGRQFKGYLESYVRDALVIMVETCPNNRADWIKTAEMLSELYLVGMARTDFLFDCINVFLYSELPVSQIIEFIETLLTRPVVKNFKREHVDEQFLFFIDVMKLGAKHDKYTSRNFRYMHLKPKEITELTSALIKIEFLPDNALQFDKVSVFIRTLEHWCHGLIDLDQAVEDIAKLNLASFGEFSSIAHFTFNLATESMDNQDKIAVLLMHLKTKIYKHCLRVFDEGHKAHLRGAVESFFAKSPKSFLVRNTTIVRYLCSLFNHDVIDEEIIVTSLNLFIDNFGLSGNASFTAMYSSVDVKLENKISDEENHRYLYHFVNNIIGNNVNLPLGITQWLSRSQNKLYMAAEKLRKGKDEKRDQIDEIKRIIQNFCKEFCSLEQAMKDFAALKMISTEGLRFTFNQASTQALLDVADHRKLVTFLKKLRITNMQNSKLFNELLEDQLKVDVQDFFEDTSLESLDRNWCFISYLSHLFYDDVIGVDLIMESLNMFIENCGGTNDDCFINMFTQVAEKFETRVCATDFDKMNDHFNNYILVNHTGNVPLTCSTWLERERFRAAKTRIAARSNVQ